MKTKIRGLILGAAGLGLSVIGSPLQAATLYQSIPDLTAAPYNGLCSSCAGQYQLFDTFALGGASTISGISFDAYNYSPYLTSTTNVTVDIYSIVGGLPSTLLYGNTFTPAQYSVATGHASTILSSILTVAPSGLNLAAGSYYISFFNPSNFSVTAYTESGHSIFAEITPGSTAPANYFSDSNLTLGFSVEGAPVAETPLPAALPLFATGLGALGLLARRRKKKNASAIAA